MRTLPLLPILFLAFCGLADASPERLDSATRSVMAAHAELPPAVWKRILEVRGQSGNTVAHYLVFNLHHTFFCYSAKDGSRRIWPANETPTSLARAISSSFAGGTATFVQPATPASAR